MGLRKVQCLAIIALCMYVHLRGLCVVGFCKLPPANLPSALFTLSVSWVLVQSALYPCCLKRLHPLPLFAFEVIMALLINNIALAIIWTPLVQTFMRFLGLVSQTHYFPKATQWIDPFSIMMSVIIFATTLYATESLDNVIKFAGRYFKSYRGGERQQHCRRSESPEPYPDSLWYT